MPRHFSSAYSYAEDCNMSITWLGLQAWYRWLLTAERSDVYEKDSQSDEIWMRIHLGFHFYLRFSGWPLPTFSQPLPISVSVTHIDVFIYSFLIFTNSIIGIHESALNKTFWTIRVPRAQFSSHTNLICLLCYRLPSPNLNYSFFIIIIKVWGSPHRKVRVKWPIELDHILNYLTSRCYVFCPSTAATIVGAVIIHLYFNIHLIKFLTWHRQIGDKGAV